MKKSAFAEKAIISGANLVRTICKTGNVVHTPLSDTPEFSDRIEPSEHKDRYFFDMQTEMFKRLLDDTESKPVKIKESVVDFIEHLLNGSEFDTSHNRFKYDTVFLSASLWIYLHLNIHKYSKELNSRGIQFYKYDEAIRIVLKTETEDKKPRFVMLYMEPHFHEDQVMYLTPYYMTLFVFSQKDVFEYPPVVFKFNNEHVKVEEWEVKR